MEAPDVGLVRSIAAFGLPDGDGDHDPPPQSIDDETWSRALSALQGTRITGLAMAGAEAGWLSLSDEQWEELAEAHRVAMLAPLAVERGLLEIGSVFEAEEIGFVVLKGPALAHTVYPDPSWRYFGDLDLLVRGSDWRRATAVLESLGFHRTLPEPRKGFDERFGKAAEFRRENDIEVDLHRTLVVGPFGLWIEPDALFERTTELSLWSRTFKRLDDTMLQLHACMHASLGWWPPLKVPVRDVAQVAHYGAVDWDALLVGAMRWKVGAVVRHALQTTRDDLGVGFPAGAGPAMTYQATRTERRALSSYVSYNRNSGGTALGTLRAIRGLRAKLAYIRALLFPGRDFMAARSGRPTYLHRLAIPVRWVLARKRVR